MPTLKSPNMSALSVSSDCYKYEPLDPATEEIRLIKLESNASSNAQPCCTIHTFPLSLAPTYMTLSYTWGPPVPPHQIVVNNRVFEIRSDLNNFLQTLQMGVKSVPDFEYLYCDQLCINQEDVAERSAQVQLMSNIYSLASTVVAWLGIDSKIVRAARGLERDIEKVFENQVSAKNYRIIVSSVYFTRLWIVQELIFSIDIYLLAGERKRSRVDTVVVSEFDLARISKSATARVSRRGSDDGDFSFNWFKRAQEARSWSLDQLLGHYSSQRCQDPRDKVYGLIGIVSDRLRPSVDYSKSITQVYNDALEICVRRFLRIEKIERIWPCIKNMLTLACDMDLLDHGKRGLYPLFRKIITNKEQLARTGDITAGHLNGQE